MVKLGSRTNITHLCFFTISSLPSSFQIVCFGSFLFLFFRTFQNVVLAVASASEMDLFFSLKLQKSWHFFYRQLSWLLVGLSFLTTNPVFTGKTQGSDQEKIFSAVDCLKNQNSPSLYPSPLLYVSSNAFGIRIGLSS